MLNKQHSGTSMTPKYKYHANVANPYPSKTYSGYILSDLLLGRTRIDMPPYDDPTRKTRFSNSQNPHRNLLLQSMYHEIKILLPRKAIQICKSSFLSGNFTFIGRMVVHFSINLRDQLLSPAHSSMGPISYTGSFCLLVQHSYQTPIQTKKPSIPSRQAAEMDDKRRR